MDCPSLLVPEVLNIPVSASLVQPCAPAQHPSPHEPSWNSHRLPPTDHGEASASKTCFCPALVTVVNSYRFHDWVEHFIPMLFLWFPIHIFSPGDVGITNSHKAFTSISGNTSDIQTAICLPPMPTGSFAMLYSPIEPACSSLCFLSTCIPWGGEIWSQFQPPNISSSAPFPCQGIQNCNWAQKLFHHLKKQNVSPLQGYVSPKESRYQMHLNI